MIVRNGIFCREVVVENPTLFVENGNSYTCRQDTIQGFNCHTGRGGINRMAQVIVEDIGIGLHCKYQPLYLQTSLLVDHEQGEEKCGGCQYNHET
ncbi:hypothetical protein SDC9_203261 [bioreactor metagenome]|uniref:Uncharacterized protein n=1 Tax=bioreactor metagenome TaxID=1076179 RepID=A0A645IWR5_9ZZZZ